MKVRTDLRAAVLQDRQIPPGIMLTVQEIHDYDPKNTFDIEKYLNRKEKIHPGDEFIVVDADSLPPA